MKKFSILSNHEKENIIKKKPNIPHEKPGKKGQTHKTITELGIIPFPSKNQSQSAAID